MRRLSSLIPGLLLIATAAFGQTASTNSQALEALLQEVRQLRQDLRTTALAVQRAQILIYRAQAQEAVVARASQRLDDARSKLAAAQSGRKRLALDAKHLEDRLGPTGNPNERKQLEETLAQFKARLEQLADEEQQMQARETECEVQLRNEQAKLSDLHDELDRLDKVLETSSRP